MNNIQVPEKLSDLIALAVKDMRQTVLVSSDYVIDMNRFYNKGSDGTCYVCFAGAVMAGTLNCGPDSDLDFFEMPITWCRAMGALDEVRKGRIRFAYMTFKNMPIGLKLPDGLLEIQTKTKDLIPLTISKGASWLKKTWKPS